ncbi:MAG: hypothetical protein PHE24_04045 [Patescibacteria group bacterium]|nr:hypothetical protein [Patescibacteria group bacterium]
MSMGVSFKSIASLIDSDRPADHYTLVVTGDAASPRAGETSLRIYANSRGLTAVVKKSGNEVDSVEIKGQGQELTQFFKSIEEERISRLWLAETIPTRADIVCS